VLLRSNARMAKPRSSMPPCRSTVSRRKAKRRPPASGERCSRESRHWKEPHEVRPARRRLASKRVVARSSGLAPASPTPHRLCRDDGRSTARTSIVRPGSMGKPSRRTCRQPDGSAARPTLHSAATGPFLRLQDRWRRFRDVPSERLGASRMQMGDYVPRPTDFKSNLRSASRFPRANGLPEFAPADRRTRSPRRATSPPFDN